MDASNCKTHEARTRAIYDTEQALYNYIWNNKVSLISDIKLPPTVSPHRGVYWIEDPNNLDNLESICTLWGRRVVVYTNRQNLKSSVRVIVVRPISF